MPQFRLTQKYAKDCKIKELLDPDRVDHPLDDWFIDVIRVHRRKITMVTHAQSTLTFFIPYSEAGGAIFIPKYIGTSLKKFLLNHDVFDWAEQVDAFFNQPFTFCKTVDKKILGHMNDFKWCSEGYYRCHDQDYLNQLYWDKISENINNMPVKFASERGLTYPIQVFSQLIGHPLKDK